MTPVPRGTQERLSLYVDLLRAESERQNLVARSTLEDVWQRHIADSLQLVPLAQAGRWLDIGSGAGLPGLVIAIARPDEPMLLAEPRPLRADFLRRAVTALGLPNVEVATAKAETLAPAEAAIISARAVAPLDRLLALGQRHAAPGCRWLLPKGRTAAEELAVAQRTWQGAFELIPSQTDPEASIIMAHDVAPRTRRFRR
jgi:16S rRNA (guanine527-N7)-methyltransferase